MPVRTGRRDWLWGIALGVVGITAAFIAFAVFRPSNVKTYATVAGVDCQTGERLEFHAHAFLSIVDKAVPVTLPAQIGIRSDCLFWLHTHAENGIIHIEAPKREDFTLGQFFAIWGQPLSKTQLLNETADQEHQIVVTVNGETYAGDPSEIVLADGQTIVLQYGPPFGEAPVSPFQQTQ